MFLDTANLHEIRDASSWGVVSGVTTNQKIFLVEKGCDFRSRVEEICSMIDGPVSVETTSRRPEDLIREGEEYASWNPKVVVKAAMYGNGDGLRVVRELHRRGVKTNMTCMVTTNQLILAARAGATYASLFYNRAKDCGEDPQRIIKEWKSIFRNDECETKLIVGSIRNPSDVVEAAVAGADIITIPYKILVQMPFHEKTEETIAEFDRAWAEFLRTQKVAPTAR